jgi:hypothetical protein
MTQWHTTAPRFGGPRRTREDGKIRLSMVFDFAKKKIPAFHVEQPGSIQIKTPMLF